MFYPTLKRRWKNICAFQSAHIKQPTWFIHTFFVWSVFSLYPTRMFSIIFRFLPLLCNFRYAHFSSYEWMKTARKKATCNHIYQGIIDTTVEFDVVFFCSNQWGEDWRNCVGWSIHNSHTHLLIVHMLIANIDILHSTVYVLSQNQFLSLGFYAGYVGCKTRCICIQSINWVRCIAYIIYAQ